MCIIPLLNIRPTSMAFLYAMVAVILEWVNSAGDLGQLYSGDNIGGGRKPVVNTNNMLAYPEG
ncbi:hypothetical protein A7X67_15840 [Clostridium sp. W14A]|nr:hypothetical protein A7X67_15840 [Clostridium sp. W14A]